MDPRFPILVIGLPGVPGYNAFFYLRRLFPGQVVGLVPPNAPELMVHSQSSEAKLVMLDPEVSEDVERLFDTYGFQSVVDASGWCALKPCEKDPALGRRLNVNVGYNIAKAAKRLGARLIRLSTDLVFDGCAYADTEKTRELKLGNYTEDHPVSPVTMYGKLMAESEQLTLETDPAAAILRIALPMGPSLRGYAGAIDWIESRFRKGNPATLYFDEVRSNLYVQDLNQVIQHFLSPKGSAAHGLFHTGGPLPLSLYQIAQIVNKVGNYPSELLMGCMRIEAGPMPPRAGNVTMDTSKLQKILTEFSIGNWPAKPAQIPTDPDWHKQRTKPFPPNAIAHELFGKGGIEAWDHPLRLLATRDA